MNETIENQKQDIEAAQPSGQDEFEESCCKRSWRFSSILIAVVVMSVIAVIGYKVVSPAGGLMITNESLAAAALSDRIDDLELRLKKAESQLGDSRASERPKSDDQIAQAGVSGAQDIEKLKIGLAGLSNALGLLQTELERSSKVSNENNLNTQAGLATVLGYVLLQRAAVSGLPFEKERQDLRKVAEGDQELVDTLIKLEPYALSGVMTSDVLLKEWKNKSVEAQIALRKAGAQTWIDRILVALEGLVSIRSLTPKAGDSLSFSVIDMDLAQGKLLAAQEKVAALPAEVQAVIEPWRKGLEARTAVDTMMGAMATHLLVRGTQREATQPEPAVSPQSVGTP